MDYPKVLVAAPVRDRERTLPLYLQCLRALDYPEDCLEFYFLVNDSTDKSEALIEEFVKNTPNAHYETWNLGTVKDARVQNVRLRVYEALAKLRNRVLETFEQSDCEYLLSIDSDIYAQPGLLKRLISHKKDFVGSVISNSPKFHCPNAMLKVPSPKFPDRTHWSRFREDKEGLYKVDLTGAVCLMSRKVLCCRYSWSKTGEDAPFCEDLAAAGIDLWFDTKPLCTHDMREDAYSESGT